MSLLQRAFLAGAACAAAASAQSWRVIGPEPSPRVGHCLVHDPATDRLLVVGGQDDEFSMSPTTALRVGTRWNPADVPSVSRVGFAAGADPLRGRVVLNGGHVLFSGPRADTWEWDGSGWNLAATAGPNVLHGASMCWHGGTQRLVLYGAGPSAAQATETWEWDGANWTQRLPPLDPGVRLGAAMSYDAGRDRVVLFGGVDAAYRPLANTWEWNGATWTPAQPANEPPSHSGFVMTYDERRRVTVLHGNGTHEYDGTDWTTRTPANSPGLRYGHALGWDRSRGVVVLHGGRGASPSSDWQNDTWEWDGVDWTLVDGTPGPGKRHHAKVATDPATGRALLHGGQVGVVGLADTWRLDADRWTLLPQPALQPLVPESELVGDPLRGHLLAFPAGAAVGARTWSLQNGTWTQHAPAAEPSARVSHALAYDPLRAVAVLSGGYDLAARTIVDDTWEWDGSTWTQVGGAAPPARSEHEMAPDLAGGGVLLFGGLGAGGLRGDTWRLTAAGWQQVATSGPTPRMLFGMAADATRNRVVLAGGLGNGTAPSDHWEWDGVQWNRIGPIPEGTTWYVAGSRRGAVLIMDRLAYEFGRPRASATGHGQGCAGPSGTPRLAAGGLPQLGAARLLMALDRAPGSSFGAVVADVTGSPLPVPPCTLAMPNPTSVLIVGTSPGGAAQWTVAVPDQPALRGLRFAMQVAVLDPGGGFFGLASLTNGVLLTVDD